jgi:hypothetical protein
MTIMPIEKIFEVEASVQENFNLEIPFLRGVH